MKLDQTRFGSAHLPTEIRQISAEKVLEITWENGLKSRYSMEALRVFCPCAECRGHTPDQKKLIDGKLDVTLKMIEPVGHYAVRLGFSDDHDSGIYDWEMLFDLDENMETYWKGYEAELQQAGKRRRPSVFAIKVV
ncbi:protein of unknown function DUF971 [Magnetococcus marinus MC-1]|uniref:Gamma-butyrobetaine hydroxylase-like N-terminal domain-containing protein n=1 Tax=Magnetococcus marinus (strain ATCC BAA-1437 / JCM 17883 / MC-1) TaxID=156889 RepID=A0L848_MAGMM|nr:DUF971 domain-containing protein [Magnetococcus marinus]ABK44141.1 protein of unknown function DUF971 [Magnetococcus marinus MC-1]